MRFKMNRTADREKILVYGDARDASLEWILKSNGYDIVSADVKQAAAKAWDSPAQAHEAGRTAGEALAGALADGEVSLLLLCPGSGEAGQMELLALLEELGNKKNKPILVRMRGESETERILTLNAGADDVLGGDCSLLVCLARIQALLRCYRRLLAGQKQSRRIRMGGLEMDDDTKQVRVEGNRVNLTPTEYKILYLLMEHPGRIWSNSQIYESIWQMSPIGADNTVAVHIRHIREKIEENPRSPRYLQVVWGQGYKVG
jgi:DNA-binding response OmpR family regulator